MTIHSGTKRTPRIKLRNLSVRINRQADIPRLFSGREYPAKEQHQGKSDSHEIIDPPSRSAHTLCERPLCDTELGAGPKVSAEFSSIGFSTQEICIGVYNQGSFRG